jgi:hypothetical protein
MVDKDTLTAIGISVAAAGVVSVVSSIVSDSQQEDITGGGATPIGQIPTADDVARAIRENVDPTDTPTDPDTDLSEGEERNAREGLGADQPDSGGEAPDSPWTGGWSDLTGYSPYGIGTRIGLNEGDDAEDGDPLVGL